MPDHISNRSTAVSVPLRGNGYRKSVSLTEGTKLEVLLEVSVPLRGNGYRKSNILRHF